MYELYHLASNYQLQRPIVLRIQNLSHLKPTKSSIIALGAYTPAGNFTHDKQISLT